MVKNDDDVDEDQMGEERTHPWSTHHISLSNLNFLHTSRGKCFGLAIRKGSGSIFLLSRRVSFHLTLSFQYQFVM